MVSSTLCPAVHILGFQNVYSRAEGIADHYWPRTIILSIYPLFIPDISHLAGACVAVAFDGAALLILVLAVFARTRRRRDAFAVVKDETVRTTTTWERRDEEGIKCRSLFLID